VTPGPAAHEDGAMYPWHIGHLYSVEGGMALVLGIGPFLLLWVVIIIDRRRVDREDKGADEVSDS
jgi:hypothetical protein